MQLPVGASLDGIARIKAQTVERSLAAATRRRDGDRPVRKINRSCDLTPRVAAQASNREKRKCQVWFHIKSLTYTLHFSEAFIIYEGHYDFQFAKRDRIFPVPSVRNDVTPLMEPQSAPLAQRARRDAIAAKITPETALYFSMAAYENASRLVDGALTLQTQGHRGPARSMADSASAFDLFR